MPKVEIIHFTGMDSATGRTMLLHAHEKEFAARLLAFTKNTRLNMNPAGFREFLTKPWEEIEADLQYMAGTIPSSWEFVDVTFALGQVSRACAQQITRTRFTPMDADIFGSYAMQSFRLDKLEGLTFHVNPELNQKQKDFLSAVHQLEMKDYQEAIDLGIPQQDARGLLPMDTHCNLIVKFNLRQLVDMLRTRDQSLRVQGEYGEVAHQMKVAVLRIWPWSETFFEPKDKKAIDMIEEVSKDMMSQKGGGYSAQHFKDVATKLAKAADLLKK